LALDEAEEGAIEEEIEEEHIHDLLGVQGIISAHRYLSHDGSPVRYYINILDAYTYWNRYRFCVENNTYIRT